MNLTGGEFSTALDPLALYKCSQLSIGADLREGYNPAFFVEQFRIEANGSQKL
jgi:hypothetical protein